MPVGPSTWCLCAWHGVYQAEKRNNKKMHRTLSFHVASNSGFTLHSRYQHKKNTGRGMGGYVRLTGLQLLFRMRL